MIKKIDLNNIPSGNIYIKLNKKLVYDVLDIVKKSNTLLPKEIKTQLYRMSKGQKASLKFLKQFSLDLDVPIEEIQQNTELITSAKFTDVGIRNPSFPFNFDSEDGVRLIAAIMGDGELNRQLNVRYNNQNETLINLVLNSAKNLFGDVDYKLYLRDDLTYQLHFPKITGIILNQIGILPGYKSLTNYGVPDFVFGLSKKIQAVFIKQFFNDEGNVRLKDRRLQVKQTRVVKCLKDDAKRNPLLYCHQSLIDLQTLLANLGIDSKISLGNYRGDRIDWELSIYRIENLRRFQQLIDFDVEYKRELLDKAIRSYKFPSAARNGRLEYALTCARAVERKKGRITKELLAEESRRSLKVAIYYLIDLKKAGLVKYADMPKKNNRIKSHAYNLTKE